MKKKNLFICIFIFIIATFLWSCEPEIDVPGVEKGSADFTNYIAVGNSLTAGYADEGLYRESQLASFPALLAMQMEDAGGGGFVQPLMPEGNGSGYRYLENLVFDPATGSASPVVNKYGTDPNAFAKVEGPFNNLGVPGLRVREITFAGLGASATEGNPYFFRILSQNDAMKSYLDIVKAATPTFFTCWLGNNDVLLYAASGGAYGEQGTGQAGLNGLTPVNEFAALYAALIGALKEDGAKGVIATIPDIKSTPYFTTVPKALIPLTNQEDVDKLNTAYEPYNTGVTLYNSTPGLPEERKLRKIEFKIGANYPVVTDNSIPDIGLPKISQLTEEGYLLLALPTDSIKSRGWGTQKAIPDQYSLTKSEVARINEFTMEYNVIIKQYESNDVALFDSDALLQQVKSGYYKDGISTSAAFITGGAFSLDGIHLTPRGNAIITNRLIEIINSKFYSSLSPVNISSYRGVKLP